MRSLIIHVLRFTHRHVLFRLVVGMNEWHTGFLHLGRHVHRLATFNCGYSWDERLRIHFQVDASVQGECTTLRINDGLFVFIYR